LENIELIDFLLEEDHEEIAFFSSVKKNERLLKGILNNYASQTVQILVKKPYKP